MDLTDDHVELLRCIRDRRVLPLADRRQDRIRQQLRKAALIQCVANPRRWVVTEFGMEILNKVEHLRAA